MLALLGGDIRYRCLLCGQAPPGVAKKSMKGHLKSKGKTGCAAQRSLMEAMIQTGQSDVPPSREQTV